MAEISRRELVQSYKRILKDSLDARPSGIRKQLAVTIGKDKSFVTQVTNPKYRTPLPAKYVDPMLDTIRLDLRERERFLHFYRRAHPRQRAGGAVGRARPDTRLLYIELPRLASLRAESEIDALIRQLAREINELGR